MSSIPSKSRQKRKKKNKDIPEQTSRFYRPLFLSLFLLKRTTQEKKKERRTERKISLLSEKLCMKS
jgi:hypothetical protein